VTVPRKSSLDNFQRIRACHICSPHARSGSSPDAHICMRRHPAFVRNDDCAPGKGVGSKRASGEGRSKVDRPESRPLGMHAAPTKSPTRMPLPACVQGAGAASRPRSSTTDASAVGETNRPAESTNGAGSGRRRPSLYRSKGEKQSFGGLEVLSTLRYPRGQVDRHRTQAPASSGSRPRR
jgi:hypothetical protein